MNFLYDALVSRLHPVSDSSPIHFLSPTSTTCPSHTKILSLLRDILSLMHPKEKFRAIYAVRLKFARL